MDMKGEFRIPLPQDTVWRALNDPEILKGAIPGCEELVRESDTKFKGKVFASVGPVKARFGGEAILSDIDPPNGYTLTGSGSGGPAGMAKGSAVVRLRSEGPAETILEYEVKAQVAGKLAQIGARLVDMAAKKMADDFFGNFVRLVVPPAVMTAAAPPGMPEFEPSATVPETGFAQRRSWIGWAVVVLIAIIVVAVLWVRLG